MKGKSSKSISDSLARIVGFNYKSLSEDQIIVARVTAVYSDILDIETFGTMDCYDEKNKIEIVDIPLNAHINEDGSGEVSGKYQFPKINSTVYLASDISVNRETFIPILFSHINKVYESYSEEFITEISEITTEDINAPYDTAYTGVKSKKTQSFDAISGEVLVDDVGSSYDISSSSVAFNVEDSSESAGIELTAAGILFDGGTGLGEESSTKGDTLKQILEDLISAINGITTVVTGITASAGSPLAATGSISVGSSAQMDLISTQLSTILNEKVKLK